MQTRLGTLHYYPPHRLSCPSHGPLNVCTLLALFSNGLPKFSHTSFPHASHPSARSRANSSILFTSPIKRTMLSRTSGGFAECRPICDITKLLTDALTLFGLPRVASRQISVLLRVQFPSPINQLSDRLFFFTHTNAAVLYSNPHARIVSKASRIIGNVAHRNKTQSCSAISSTCRFFISSKLIVP